MRKLPGTKATLKKVSPILSIALANPITGSASGARIGKLCDTGAGHGLPMDGVILRFILTAPWSPASSLMIKFGDIAV